MIDSQRKSGQRRIDLAYFTPPLMKEKSDYMRKFIYDESCTMYVKDNYELNVHFLVEQERYVNGLLVHRGYVYLNQICELLGIGWNPKKHRNKCFIYKKGKCISFNTTYTENGFELRFELI